MSSLSNDASTIHVVLSQSGTYGDIIVPMVASGAVLHHTDRQDIPGGKLFYGRKELLLSMLSPRILRLRGAWKADDRVLLIGWSAIPILALIKLGWIKQPRKVLVTGCFIHSKTARKIMNVVLKALKFDGLYFAAFSKGEAENLTHNVGMPPDRVFVHLWRQELNGRADKSEIVEGDYIFSGGYTNRDYDLLIEAARTLETKIVIAASERNQIKTTVTPNMVIYRDLDEGGFEKLLAGAKLVVLPLRETGEACGQSVLLRVLRNAKPLILTRHESVEDYLGADYPGFIPAEDIYAMRSMLQRAIQDKTFRAELARSVAVAARSLENRHPPHEDIMGYLNF